MKSEKTHEWQESLKKGDPIRVLYYNMELLGVFVSWKESSYDRSGNGCKYLAVPYWQSNYKDKIRACKDRKNYLDFINCDAERRVLPVDERFIDDVDKECLTILKEKML